MFVNNNICKVEYIFKNIPSQSGVGPGYITLKEGGEIKFGQGRDGDKLGQGPSPWLCNLQLAVARVLRMSGAAEVITQLMEDADDTDTPHIFLASPDFCNVLSAKLVLSGGTLV
jgi:hypothetical protein